MLRKEMWERPWDTNQIGKECGIDIAINMGRGRLEWPWMVAAGSLAAGWLAGCWLAETHAPTQLRSHARLEREADFIVHEAIRWHLGFLEVRSLALTIIEIIGSRVALKVLPWSSTIYIYFFSFANASPTQSKVSVASSWDQGNFATASRHLLRYRRCHRQTVTWLALKLSRQRLWCKQETRGVLQVWQATSYATCAW
jgi:hypothetical protein